MSEEKKEGRRRRTEFDDALRGYYQDHDEIRPDELTDYRSLTAESVGSLILGFLSILTFVHWIFAIFPIMGLVLGIVAIRKILGASEVLGGLGISTAGVLLCTVFSVSGFAYLTYMQAFSVPPGYYEITFDDLTADPKTGRIPQEILQLATKEDPAGNRVYGVPVFIEGYMFQTRKMTEIDRFVLVPALEQGKFAAPTRRPTETIQVNLVAGLTATYRTSPVRVGGFLYVNEQAASGETPYRIEADVFR